MRIIKIIRIMFAIADAKITRKNFLFEEFPYCSEIEDMTKVREISNGFT